MTTTCKRTLSALALVAAALLLPAWARAQETPPPAFAPLVAAGGGFGVVGQWVVSGQANAHLHKQSGGGWDLTLAPALDTFIAPSVSIGGAVQFSHDSGGNTSVGLGARAGYNLNIDQHIGIWPLAGLSVTRNSQPHGSDTSASLNIFAPFLYHLVPHLFVGLGPSFGKNLSGGGYQYGLDSIVGGWF